MPVIDDINAEKKKFKDMNFKGKAQYIWDYYRVPIIVVAGILFLSIFIIKDIISNNRETYLNACMINTNYIYDTETTLINDYINYAGVDTDAMQLNIDYSMKIDLEGGDQMSLAYQQKIMALFAANELDLMIADNNLIDSYASADAFANIEEFLPDDLKAELEEKGFSYYTAKTEDGSTIPVGVCLENCKRFEMDGTAGTYAEDVMPVYAVVYNAPHPEHAIEYLRFLISEN